MFVPSTATIVSPAVIPVPCRRAWAAGLRLHLEQGKNSVRVVGAPVESEGDAMSSEAEVLLGSLNLQRAHVLGAVEGLSDEQLRRPVLPSGWNCLGMLKHLALADEHYWFRSVVGGEPLDFLPREGNPDWTVAPDETAADVFDLYRAEIERANVVIADTPVDMAPRQPDPLWREWGMDFPNLRVIMLHVIGETACHAGHLDAVREIIDGSQWIVM
jgi:hypothetical protein